MYFLGHIMFGSSGKQAANLDLENYGIRSESLKSSEEPSGVNVLFMEYMKY